MKKFLTICLLLVSMPGYSQISGGFYSEKDIYGNAFVYFKGQNTSYYNYNIKVTCVNEQTRERSSFYINLLAGNSFTVGPANGWTWLPQEKLYVTYPNNQSVYWVYNLQRNNPSFKGWLGCTQCKCKGWPTGRNKNEKCNNIIKTGVYCGHSFEEHK